MDAQPVFCRLTAALSLAALFTSCTIEDTHSERPAADSAAGAVVSATPQVSTVGSVPVPGAFGSDSAIHVRPMGPREITEALKTDTARTLEVVDSAPAAAPSDVDLATLRREMMIPVSGIAVSALHDNYNEMRGARTHEALDILAPRGAPVLSATPGRVLKLFNSKAGGLMVYAADSTEHFILMYAHLDAYQPGLADGQPLRRGQQIGIVGTTGNAPPGVPHLHFAIARSSDVKQWWKGAPVNPFPLLAPR
jgi:murein DD-endopeptidase MepM/ murein hydrolase activator NlpD